MPEYRNFRINSSCPLSFLHLFPHRMTIYRKLGGRRRGRRKCGTRISAARRSPVSQWGFQSWPPHRELRGLPLLLEFFYSGSRIIGMDVSANLSGPRSDSRNSYCSKALWRSTGGIPIRAAGQVLPAGTSSHRGLHLRSRLRSGPPPRKRATSITPTTAVAGNKLYFHYMYSNYARKMSELL